MRGHDAGQVLAALLLALLHGADLGGRRPCAVRGRRRALNARVHVCAVVVAHVHHVVSALHGTGQALQADVVGAAVAAKGAELDLLVGGDLAGALQAVVGCLDAGHGRGAVRERVVDKRGLPGRIRVDRRGHLQAARRAAAHDVGIARAHQHLADADRRSAAAAQTVAAGEALGKSGEFFEICHRFLPLLICFQGIRWNRR